MKIKKEFFKKDINNKLFGYRKWYSPIGRGLYHADGYEGKIIYETTWLFTLPFIAIRITVAPYCK